MITPTERAIEDCFLEYYEKRLEAIDLLLLGKEYSHSLLWKNGEIELHFSPPLQTQNIKISLLDTKEQFLHLEGIYCYSGSGDTRIPIEEKYSVTISSAYPGTDNIHFSLNESKNPFIFHTKKELSPYIQISFDSSVEISILKIINRKNGHSTPARSHNLLVEATTQGKELQAVFDHAQHHNNFTDELRLTRANTPSFLDESHAQIIDSIFIECMSRQHRFGPLFEKITNIPVKNSLHQFIFDKFLSPKKLEFTAYGVQKTFRFWTNIGNKYIC